jgi:hypothetical protein
MSAPLQLEKPKHLKRSNCSRLTFHTIVRCPLRVVSGHRLAFPAYKYLIKSRLKTEQVAGEKQAYKDKLQAEIETRDKISPFMALMSSSAVRLREPV